MMRRRRALRAMAALLVTAALCMAANILAFTMDSEDMREHVWQGCLMLGEQLSNPQTVGGFMTSRMDNYTGVMILKTAGYVGEEDLLHKAFGGLRVDMPPQEDQTEWEAYCNYEFGELAPQGSIISYSRYWHGYILPLRALLSVFDTANLQMTLYFAQLALMMFVFFKMAARGLGALMPGFFLAYFLMMPFSSSVCLQYVPVTMLMLAGCACILCWDEAIDRAIGLPAFFAISGVLTNYFDLLTFPLAALCYPLILLLALRMRRGDSLWQLLRRAVLCGLAWGLGFALMWALKWGVNALVFGWGTLANVFTQIGLRSGDNGGELSRLTVLAENFGIFLRKKSYLVVIGLCGLASLRPWIKAIRARRFALDIRALALLAPGAAACLWIVLLSNHAHDHAFYTYRNVTAAVFAGMACIACLIGEDERV